MLLSRRIISAPRRFTTTTIARSQYRLLSTPSNNDRLLVIGSGVAGSAAALVAAELYNIPTTLIFAGAQPTDCNSYWAQGGIIYKGREGDDSPALLAEDIHRAGAGLCYDPAVEKVASEGANRVSQLLLDAKNQVFSNVPFQRDENGDLSLTLGELRDLFYFHFCIHPFIHSLVGLFAILCWPSIFPEESFATFQSVVTEQFILPSFSTKERSSS